MYSSVISTFDYTKCDIKDSNQYNLDRKTINKVQSPSR